MDYSRKTMNIYINRPICYFQFHSQKVFTIQTFMVTERVANLNSKSKKHENQISKLVFASPNFQMPQDF